MTVKKINEYFSIFTRQLEISDIKNISDLGYKTIVCNRPDHEEGSISSIEIKKECLNYSINFYYLPFNAHTFNEDIINEMRNIFKNCDKPLIGYCRTGTRTSMLFQNIVNF